MVLCNRCGSEEMDVPLVIAVPAKRIEKEKTDEKYSSPWSQVSQKICPVCGARHVSISCSPKHRPE